MTKTSLPLLIALGGCGPRTDATDESGSSSTPPTTETATADAATGPAATDGEERCVHAPYPYERIELGDFDRHSIVGVADLVGDGRPNIAVRRGNDSSSTTFSVLRWENGGLQLVTERILGSGEQCWSLPPSFGRPTGEGGAHVLFARSSGIRRCWLVDNDVAFAVDPWLDVDFSFAAEVHGQVYAIDVDGDGRDEILLYEAWTLYQRYGGGTMPHIFEHTRDGWREHSLPFPELYLVHDGSAVVADLDGEGRPSLVLMHDVFSGDVDSVPSTYEPEFHHVVVVRPTGNGYEERWRAPAGVVATQVLVDDLDGDGHPDLVLAGPDGIAVARGMGGGSFTQPERLVLAGYDPGDSDFRVESVAAADLDGSGERELVALLGWPRPHDLVVVRDPLNAGEAVVLLEKAAGSSTSFEVIDIDEDGIDDIVVRTSDDPPGTRSGDRSYSLRLLKFGCPSGI